MWSYSDADGLESYIRSHSHMFSYCESLGCYEHSSTIAFRADKELIGLSDMMSS